VQRDAGKEEQPHEPEGGTQGLQEVGVAVDLVGCLEDLEVADQVPKDEADQDHASGRHDQFPANGAAEEVSG